MEVAGAMKKLAGLNNWDRTVLDYDGMPIAYCVTDPPDHVSQELFDMMSRTVSQAAAGLPVEMHFVPGDNGMDDAWVFAPDLTPFGMQPGSLDSPQFRQTFSHEPFGTWYGEQLVPDFEDDDGTAGQMRSEDALDLPRSEV